MKLDDRERIEVAQLLLSTVEDDQDEDDLDEAETARLHAALERSLDDIKAGRVHDASLVEFFRSAPTGGKRLDLGRKRDATRTLK